MVALLLALVCGDPNEKPGSMEPYRLFPPQAKCRENYYLALSWVTDLEGLGEWPSSTWKMQCELAEARWYRDFWWAMWWVTWDLTTADDRARWAGTVKGMIGETDYKAGHWPGVYPRY